MVTQAKYLPVSDFQEVYGIIQAHRQRVAGAVNRESLTMIWEVGGYISNKLRDTEWEDSIVRQLAEYISTQDATVRGWSYRRAIRNFNHYGLLIKRH